MHALIVAEEKVLESSRIGMELFRNTSANYLKQAIGNEDRKVGKEFD